MPVRINAGEDKPGCGGPRKDRVLPVANTDRKCFVFSETANRNANLEVVRLGISADGGPDFKTSLPELCLQFLLTRAICLLSGTFAAGIPSGENEYGCADSPWPVTNGAPGCGADRERYLSGQGEVDHGLHVGRPNLLADHRQLAILLRTRVTS